VIVSRYTDEVIAKRKREEDREKEEKVNNSINKYFTAKPAAVAAPKAKVSREVL
jgi:hypothetical protein